MTHLATRRRLRAVLPVALAALAGGCGSSRPAKPAAAIAVNEQDFHISAPARISTEEVSLRVHNRGPDRHEFIVARVGGRGAAGLPLRSDGLTLDEETLQKSEVGELEPGAPGSTRTLHLKLAPGRYVFFCNMAGHFMGGMHAEVVVQ
jgi:hypothetical protein